VDVEQEVRVHARVAQRLLGQRPHAPVRQLPPLVRLPRTAGVNE